MNDRKQHVIKIAHQLFIEKGFQATSIQDILDASGISKGTFYNYFSSKSELLIALFKTIYRQLNHERDQLLIGQSSSNIDIFIKQIELQTHTNRVNKLIALFEEVIVSNDADLKQYIEKVQINNIGWIYQRFIDIFGDSKQPYLLDCCIMFIGMLRNNIKYSGMAYGSNLTTNQIVRYSVDRIMKMVEEVSDSRDQLIHPDYLQQWLPAKNQNTESFKQNVYQIISTLKKALHHNPEQEKYLELLEFIKDELLDIKKPRKFLVESALMSIKTGQAVFEKAELEKLEQLVAEFFTQAEDLEEN